MSAPLSRVCARETGPSPRHARVSKETNAASDYRDAGYARVCAFSGNAIYYFGCYGLLQGRTKLNERYRRRRLSPIGMYNGLVKKVMLVKIRGSGSGKGGVSRNLETAKRHLPQMSWTSPQRRVRCAHNATHGAHTPPETNVARLPCVGGATGLARELHVESVPHY